MHVNIRICLMSDMNAYECMMKMCVCVWFLVRLECHSQEWERDRVRALVCLISLHHLLTSLYEYSFRKRMVKTLNARTPPTETQPRDSMITHTAIYFQHANKHYIKKHNILVKPTTKSHAHKVKSATDRGFGSSYMRKHPFPVRPKVEGVSMNIWTQVEDVCDTWGHRGQAENCTGRDK